MWHNKYMTDTGGAVDPIPFLRRVTEALGGHPRPGQDQMVSAVSEALENGSHLIVQAGTGTGKSMGYLVPALVSGKRVIVSTATLALQDQLAKKDLPHLRRTLGIPFNWAVLKGRNNYLCVQKARELADSGYSDRSDKDDIDYILTWAKQTETGDRADLLIEPSPETWSDLSSGSNECPKASKCPSGGRCWAEAARANTRTADVIVVNHHLLTMDWLSRGHVLPEHEMTIIDEAHELPEVTAGAFSSKCNGRSVQQLAYLFKTILEDEEVYGALMQVGQQLGEVLRVQQEDHRFLELPRPVSIALKECTDQIEAAKVKLAAIQGKPDAWQVKRERVLYRADKLLSTMMTFDVPDSQDVIWVSKGTLNKVPVDIAPYLRQLVWQENPAVLCSATIPLDLQDKLGIDQAKWMEAESPFDYSSQGLLYVPNHIPNPKSDRTRWEMMAMDLSRGLIEAAGGRTLMLFTSWGMLGKARQLFEDQLPWPVYVQGDLPKPELIRRFTEEHDSVLLATRSFWSGIDIPGAALSLVIIDKLPFAAPGDPVGKARRENVARQGGNPFSSIDIPEAVTTLAQGVGRLIRTTKDRGVVAVLDPRLADTTWGKSMIGKLPPLPMTRDFGVAADFLHQL